MDVSFPEIPQKSNITTNPSGILPMTNTVSCHHFSCISKPLFLLCPHTVICFMSGDTNQTMATKFLHVQQHGLFCQNIKC